MTRTQARRRRKRRRRLRQIEAWTIIILLELAAAAAPTIILAAILFPFAYRERGYAAMGSEWLMIAATFCITYSIVHKRICEKIFRQEE